MAFVEQNEEEENNVELTCAWSESRDIFTIHI